MVKRRRFASGGLVSRVDSGLVAGLDRFNGFDSWFFFHAVARRAPMIKLASPKSVWS